AAGPSRAGAGKEGTAGAPAGAVDPGRHFRRDRRHQMFGGVCSGLARQYDMDPVIFRITLAVLSATGGIGLIFY
ncbi:PspC domain-containing protein, partial [Actinospica acidiphila]